MRHAGRHVLDEQAPQPEEQTADRALAPLEILAVKCTGIPWIFHRAPTLVGPGQRQRGTTPPIPPSPSHCFLTLIRIIVFNKQAIK
jgi:hypothetical protein